jgi:hypothetical protein
MARLDAQATRLSTSLSELLQLKQAHCHSFGLESSRNLAMTAVRQGRAMLCLHCCHNCFLTVVVRRSIFYHGPDHLS